LEPFINQASQRLLHCPVCNLYQKGFLDSDSLYENDYHDEYFRRLGSKTVTAKIRLGAASGYLQNRHPRSLDVGCSVGASVKAAKELGWNPSGVDISQSAVKFCRDQGFDCQKIEGVKLPFEDATFDLLTNWHVIEHVLDVTETLREWRRVLKPDGIMMLETPNSRFLKARLMGPRYKKFWPKGHLYTFDRKNLSSILERVGFEVLPNRLVGGPFALPPYLTAYALAYRGYREVWRKLDLCKSIEIICRAKRHVSGRQSKTAA
jgi:SAM-dependent methyltransferase